MDHQHKLGKGVEIVLGEVVDVGWNGTLDTINGRPVVKFAFKIAEVPCLATERLLNIYRQMHGKVFLSVHSPQTAMDLFLIDPEGDEQPGPKYIAAVKVDREKVSIASDQLFQPIITSVDTSDPHNEEPFAIQIGRGNGVGPSPAWAIVAALRDAELIGDQTITSEDPDGFDKVAQYLDEVYPNAEGIDTVINMLQHDSFEHPRIPEQETVVASVDGAEAIITLDKTKLAEAAAEEAPTSDTGKKTKEKKPRKSRSKKAQAVES
jgi:hypothetical protein